MSVGPGTVLGEDIVLERELGRGAMGVVWLAKHRALDVHVAVKLLDLGAGASAAALARFDREARAIARIDSVHVVRVTDVGRGPAGEPFLVMELLRGRDLKDRLEKEGPLSPDETVTVVEQVAEALERAHALGIIHRDLKPANVFLVAGQRTFVKVLDFGVAKVDSDPGAVALTATDTLVGTPYYMSPEQFIDPRGVDHRADLWSLAVIAYACLTGRLPFVAETPGALALVVHEGRFAPPSSVVPLLPRAVDSWFQRALLPDRGKRFQSASELAATFAQAVLGGTIEAAIGPAPSPPKRAPRRLIALGVVALLASAAIGGWLAVRRGKPPRRPSPSAASNSATATSCTPTGASAADTDRCQALCDSGESAACWVIGERFGAGTAERNDARALAAYERGCDAKDARACGRAGTFIGRGRGAGKDRTRAVAFYRRGCDDKDAESCSSLAQSLGLGLGVERDEARALGMRAEGCDHGVMADCAALAVFYDVGKGVARDVSRAASLFRHACDGGSMQGCLGLAEAYAVGDGVTKDRTLATELGRRACEGGAFQACAAEGVPDPDPARVAAACDLRQPDACVFLGWTYHDGVGVPRDPARGLAYYQLACDADDPIGCFDVGKIYSGGHIVAKDPVRAAAAFQLACEGRRHGCAELGVAYEGGFGVLQDLGRAVQLYRMACSVEDGNGCGRLGSMHERGAGVERDEVKAFELYQRGCDYDDAQSCHAAGVFCYGGRGTQKDDARTVKFIERACALDSKGCRFLADLYQSGTGVKKDVAKAAALRKQACDAGDTEACSAR